MQINEIYIRTEQEMVNWRTILSLKGGGHMPEIIKVYRKACLRCV